jgi:hypothetical protein
VFFFEHSKFIIETKSKIYITNVSLKVNLMRYVIKNVFKRNNYEIPNLSHIRIKQPIIFKDILTLRVKIQKKGGVYIPLDPHVFHKKT